MHMMVSPPKKPPLSRANRLVRARVSHAERDRQEGGSQLWLADLEKRAAKLDAPVGLGAGCGGAQGKQSSQCYSQGACCGVGAQVDTPTIVVRQVCGVHSAGCGASADVQGLAPTHRGQRRRPGAPGRGRAEPSCGQDQQERWSRLRTMIQSCGSRGDVHAMLMLTSAPRGPRKHCSKLSLAQTLALIAH